MTLSSLKIIAARFGPRPGTRIMASTDAGTSFLSFSSISSLPVVVRAAIFSARSLPMPSISVSLRFGIGGDLCRRFRQVADSPRRVAIGADAELVRALEFQDVPDLVEGIGDFGVGHGRGSASGCKCRLGPNGWHKQRANGRSFLAGERFEQRLSSVRVSSFLIGYR